MVKMIIICLIGLLCIPICLASLVCTISNETCNYTDVYHISNLTNAHAELRNESNYSYSVCCRETSGDTLLTSCGAGIINLSSGTNAHVEQINESNYNLSVCIDSVAGDITCVYQTTPCSEACLGTISTQISQNHTNLHVGDCTTDVYATYICCNYVRAGEVEEGGGGIYIPPEETPQNETTTLPIIQESGFLQIDNQTGIIITAVIMAGIIFALITMGMNNQKQKKRIKITPKLKYKLNKGIKKSEIKKENKEVDNKSIKEYNRL